MRESTRQSLDSASLPRLPRSAVSERRFEKQLPTEEENFEEVGLNDDRSGQVKKKGFFSRLAEAPELMQPSTGSRFHLGGRKRGQSGTGEELGTIQPAGATSGAKEVEEVH